MFRWGFKPQLNENRLKKRENQTHVPLRCTALGAGDTGDILPFSLLPAPLPLVENGAKCQFILRNNFRHYSASRCTTDDNALVLQFPHCCRAGRTKRWIHLLVHHIAGCLNILSLNIPS